MSAADLTGVRLVTERPDTRDDVVDTARPGPKLPEMTPWLLTAVVAVSLGAVLLGGIGLVLSFGNVTQVLAPSFGRESAQLTAAGIDVGIAVFSGAELVLARIGMRLVWLRLVPWGLTALTIALNVSGDGDNLLVKVGHGALPALWVVVVEIAAHVVRHLTGLANGEPPPDTIPIARWIMAPVATLRLQRRMWLWNIRSYPAALRMERARVLALTDLKDGYGHIPVRIGRFRCKIRFGLAWRWRAPRRDRALFKLAELAPKAGSAAAEVPAAEDPLEQASTRQLEAVPARQRPRPQARRRPTRPQKRSEQHPAEPAADVETVALRILTEQYETSGRTEVLSRRQLLEELRKPIAEGGAGGGMKTDRIDALLRRFKDQHGID